MLASGNGPYPHLDDTQAWLEYAQRVVSGELRQAPRAARRFNRLRRIALRTMILEIVRKPDKAEVDSMISRAEEVAWDCLSDDEKRQASRYWLGGRQ